jgi:hypothetical protein
MEHTTSQFDDDASGLQAHRWLITLPITVFAVCLWICSASLSAVAQITGQGTISGLVTDPSGAVVVGATVTITNIETDVAVTRTTNNTGYYEADALNPGNYKLAAASPGFSTTIRNGINLLAGAYLDVGLQLNVGNTSQVVQVTAGESLLNTESGSQGQVLTTQEMESVPISGANPMQLAAIAPGVQAHESQTFSSDGTIGWNGVSGGFGAWGRSGINDFSLDGAPNMGNGRNNAITPSVDEIGEMKLDVTGFDASVGHTLGIAVTQTTKAGTNDVHGTIRELYQDRRWAAMQRFQGLNYRYQQELNGCTNGANTSPLCASLQDRYGQPGVHENNGSASIGGPVFIPKLYDGRDKFFFFVSVLDDIYTDSSPNTLTVPTLQERSGNFNDLPQQKTSIPVDFTTACPGSPYYGQYQIYNPYSVTIGANGAPQRTPFCGNIVPSSLFGTVNAKMVSLYNTLVPLPTQNSPTAGNFVYTNPQPQTFRQFTQRMDYALSQKDHVFFRWTRAHYTKAGTGFTIGDVDIQQGPRWVDTGALGWNHVFTSQTALDVTVSATQYKTWCCYYPGYDQYSPSSVGLPSYLDTYAGSRHTLPEISPSSYQTLGNVDNTPNYFRTLSIRGNITHVEGKHTIRAGAEWQQQNTAQAVQGNQGGHYTFDDTYTQENNGTNPIYSQQNIGLSYAAFLMGIQTTSSVSTQAGYSVSTPYYALFAGDTWRVTPKLTVVPGLRYEFEYGPVEKHNEQIVGWNPTAALPVAGPANTAYQAALAGATAAQKAVLPSSLVIQGGPIYAGVNGATKQQWMNSYRIMPRLSIAYQITPQTVIRAGYGLFFDTLNARAIQGETDQDGFSATTSVSSSTTYGTNFVNGPPPLANPFPANSSGAHFVTPIGSAAGALYYLGSSPSIYDHSIVPSRANRVEIGVQHQFGKSTMIDVNWSGAMTTHILATWNRAPTPASFFSGGLQPNTAINSLLSQKINNPFNISNFSSLASTNPAAYNIISLNSYYTQTQIAISNLIRNDPQMSGFSLRLPNGDSEFQEIQINGKRRFRQGLDLNASLQLIRQLDKDYFRNPFDTQLSWETDTTAPWVFTLTGIYQFPLGRGRQWFQSGWKNAIFGGMQTDFSYELQPGALVGFGNLFYVGTPNSSIQLKHPVINNGQFTGGYNYIQWFKTGNVVATPSTVNGVTTCNYSGTGFVTNATCQPNGYNLRVFPTRIQGVRDPGFNTLQLNMQRNFHLWERFNLETRFEAFNVLNKQIVGNPNTSPTSTQFGQVTSDGGVNGSGNARWIDIQGRLRF